MSSVVGIGGESIILEESSNKNTKSVLKVAPVRGTTEYPRFEGFGIQLDNIDTDLAYEKNRPNELTANDLQHKNIIRYRDSMFEAVDDQVVHITGTKERSKCVQCVLI